ncbi:hypothetical protein OO007_06640 [Cocleimonas sp. KMM 6892]|uniref:hypothetical protein n=1 Tax=unclassified Cocleimonas TaxID=2639732 RepID=UPI002DB5C43D|nr:MULTISPECIES: hypothetical protein [unclassified Cocleimonas]MEB8431900.1 hypothetical protein [Cocleimonas sp. KMM 6892]MEC4715014.1 hypothetical protein [Cocleimonas sp. KMM 6895]MEC4744172.1 hypothetical protein [Cocleimonas sp. KMM 6896]
MKLVLKLVTLITIPVVLVVYYFTVDDKIAPEASQMYQSVGENTESDAYVYLLGIYAGVDDDPMTVGKQQLEYLRAEEKRIADKSFEEQTYKIREYPKAKRLKEFKLKSCKDFKIQDNCGYVDRLLAQNDNSEQIKTTESILLERYREFLAKDDFHTLAVPNMMTPFPSYSYLFAGNNLSHLIALEYAEKNREEEAITALLHEIKQLRHLLQQADSIVLKAIGARSISNSLDLLSVIIHKQKLDFHQTIPVLNEEEKSLEKPLNYEFAMAYKFSKVFQRNSSTDNSQTNSELGGILSRKFLYKPNMQINVAYPRYKKIIKLSKGSAKNFTGFVENDKPVNVKKSFLRNYIGDILNNVAFPDYSKYAASLFYLDAKIQLFNATANTKNLPVSPSAINNPFYDNENSAVYLENDNSLCFKVPKETRPSDNCLRIK